MKKILMMVAAVLVVGIVSAQQQKAPSLAELTTKAVEAQVITSAEKDQMMEIDKKFGKEKAALKKKGLSGDELKAENKRVDGERTKELKEVLGNKWGNWTKFKNELQKKE